MKVIGLLGGVASGKSSVAKALARRGAVILDADSAGHDALLQPAVKEAIRRRWGTRVFDTRGEVNRQAVAGIVFGDTPESRQELLFLESLTHPIIAKALSSQLGEFRQRSGMSVAVLDAAVMLKAGWDRLCDHVVFVDAPRDVRLTRARQRGWTDAQFAAREAAQEPVEEKRARSDFILNNAGTPADLENEVDRLTRWLVTAPARSRPGSPRVE
jgi:dephospho-CoA kinase